LGQSVKSKAYTFEGEDMYSIGEFSKINRITTKTLRHYDRLGLFQPAYTDQWTGYRYYKPEQLPVIKKILDFREMGFSLPEIKEILAGHEQLNGVLQRRLGELEREIQEQQLRISRVQKILHQMEGESVMLTNVELKTLPRVTVASMRTTVPNYDTYFDLVPKMGEYMESVGAVCREPAYCFTIYHDGEYRETDIDAEICEAVLSPCPESERVKFKIIEEVPNAACLKHQGPYETLSKTYNTLFSWIYTQGYIPSDNPRESYIDGIWNKETPDEWLTEVQIPVQKRDDL